MRYCLRNILALCALCNFSFSSVFAASNIPTTILGGQGPAPYAGLLDNGIVKPILGLPSTGLTYRVAINESGYGLIGGTSGTDAYASFVDPKGRLNPISGLMSPGEIYFVALNQDKIGIIGGGHSGTNTPYAALVAPTMTSTRLTPFTNLPANGLIYGVAIDSSGDGIIGGTGPAGSAYAALTNQNGTLTALPGLPTNGTIFWVATNDSKTRVIGGNNSANAYAAFITPNGLLTPIPNLPAGTVYSVDINSSGETILGGVASNTPYAALVSPDGVTHTLVGLPTSPGIIYNTAINASGTGLIGGFSASGAYGSLVSPTGKLTPLLGLPVGAGFVDGLALHDAGVGIVGGTINNVPFAALVAPNGVITYLDDLPANGEINSISIAALDSLQPLSIGPFSSYVNTQFIFSNVLTNHTMINRSDLFKNSFYPCYNNYCEDPSYYKRECEDSYSTWLSIIANYTCEKSRGNIPAFFNRVLGAMAGVDYSEIDDLVVGGALAYAYNQVDYRKDLGSSYINQEAAVLYANYNISNIYINGAIWGGLSQTDSKRKSFGMITSRSRPNGWSVSPHLELGSSLSLDSCENTLICPFIAIDWANCWQKSYHEHGSSGFNLKLEQQYGGILRTEIGMRFFKSFDYKWGQLVLEHKFSYANRIPTYYKKTKAAFAGSFSTFNIDTLSTDSLNLGIIQFHAELIPTIETGFYSSLDYQGEFESSFMSNTVTFSIGRNF